MLYISLERYFYSTSARIYRIKIYAEITEKSQVVFSSLVSLHVQQPFFTFSFQIWIYLTFESDKMVDNKSKTSLVRHIQQKIL